MHLHCRRCHSDCQLTMRQREAESDETYPRKCHLPRTWVRRQSKCSTRSPASQSLQHSKEGYKKPGSYLPPCNFLVVFGIVLVAPRTGWCVIVDVRVASPLAKPASSQSQWRVGNELRRADDVTRDRRREGIHVVTIVPLWLRVIYYTPASRVLLLQ